MKFYYFRLNFSSAPPQSAEISRVRSQQFLVWLSYSFVFVGYYPNFKIYSITRPSPVISFHFLHCRRHVFFPRSALSIAHTRSHTRWLRKQWRKNHCRRFVVLDIFFFNRPFHLISLLECFVLSSSIFVCLRMCNTLYLINSKHSLFSLDDFKMFLYYFLHCRFWFFFCFFSVERSCEMRDEALHWFTFNFIWFCVFHFSAPSISASESYLFWWEKIKIAVRCKRKMHGKNPEKKTKQICTNRDRKNQRNFSFLAAPNTLNTSGIASNSHFVLYERRLKNKWRQ